MDYAETQIKSVIQSTIDKLLTTHKTYKEDDAKYSQAAYEILHTFMNNIHLTQSLIYTSLISKPFKINQMEKSNTVDSAVSLNSNSAFGVPPTLWDKNPVSTAQTIDKSVINTEELFVPRILKSGTIPATNEKHEYITGGLDENGEFNIDLGIEQTPTPVKQQTLDKWISNTRKFNNHHYTRRNTPPHMRRHFNQHYAGFYGYDNSPPEYYEPNEEDELDSKTEWTYTEDDYGGHTNFCESDIDLDEYLSNSEFGRTTTPTMPEEFKYGVANFNMDIEQCCARIGNTIYDVEEKDPEFMDSYPADTYRDMAGKVFGLPCLNMIPIEEFEKGKIFCTTHTTGYEDIRTAPKLKPEA